MFQFTREFIINDNEGKLTGGKRFLVTAKDGKSTGTDIMFVDNMINIRKQDVNAIYKHAYEPEVKEKVVATVPTPGAALTAPTLYRLVVTLGVQGKTTATFNDYYPDHSRHFFYEVLVPAQAASGVAAAVAAGLKASYEHEKTLWGSEKFMDLTVSGATITIAAPDCYTRVKEIRLVTVPTDKQTNVGAVLTGYEDYDVVLKWERKEGTTSAVTLTPGSEGVGNTVQILKNMRLQTAANLNPYGFDMEERPLPKGKYDQYTVELVTERRHIGHDVMGSIGTSLSTVIFYVLTSDTCESQAISETFEEELAKLGTVESAVEETPVIGEETKEVIAKTKDVKNASAASESNSEDSGN